MQVDVGGAFIEFKYSNMVKKDIEEKVSYETTGMWPFRKKHKITTKNYFVQLNYVRLDGGKGEFTWNCGDSKQGWDDTYTELTTQLKNQKESLADKVFEETVLGE